MKKLEVVGIDYVDFKMLMDSRFRRNDREMIYMFLKLVFGNPKRSIFKNLQHFLRNVRSTTFIGTRERDRNGYSITREYLEIEGLGGDLKGVKMDLSRERFHFDEYVRDFVNMLNTKNDTREVSKLIDLINKFIFELEAVVYDNLDLKEGEVRRFFVNRIYEDDNTILFYLEETHEKP